MRADRAPLAALARSLAGLAGLAVLAMAATPAASRATRVPAAPGAAQRAVQAAEPGDTLLLARGTHPGPLLVDRAVVLRGEPGAVVHGGAQRSVVTVSAPGATLEDLEIRSSGRRVLTVDAGVHVVNSAGVTLRRVRLEDVLYGVYAERSDRLLLERCVLRGRVKPMDETGEGNGVHLWTSADATIRDCDASGFLDAIYLSFAHGVRVERGRFHDNGRYGLHTMYCRTPVLRDNQFDRNVAGIAIMFSNQLEVTGNRIVRNRGPRTYGLLLRDCSDGRFTDNQLVDNTVALFLDGSNRNRVERNLVQDNGWGVLMFASCAKNVFAGNDFLGNDYPVALDMRRTDNQFDDGSRGNYWSEANAWDLDGDGVGDAPHAPVTAYSFVSKQYPDLAVLAKSPAVAVLGVAERVFPALSPSTVVDRFPLVAPAGSRVTADPREPEPRAWGFAAGFGATWLAAVGGLLAARRRG
jgi:nitrous oxidase accessory protein